MDKPVLCNACERAREAKEKQDQEDYARQRKRELEQQAHAHEIAKLEAEIRKIRETTQDIERAKEMAQILDQKKKDLEDARRLANGPRTSAYEAESSLTIAPNPSNPKEKKVSGQSSLQNLSSLTNKISNPEPAPSPSKIDWDRQKRLENASNDAIDTLIEMTGLEEVKQQVLKIKARIDTALRQGINPKGERYGIVLLGNPGTGMTIINRVF